MDDERQQRQRPTPGAPWNRSEEPFQRGPIVPDIDKPDTRKLIERMRRIIPDQAKRYRQRPGE